MRRVNLSWRKDVHHFQKNSLLFLNSTLFRGVEMSSFLYIQFKKVVQRRGLPVRRIFASMEKTQIREV